MEKRYSKEELPTLAQELLVGISPQHNASVIALHGELGAGKTTLVQHLAQALGVEGEITSPTFLIMKIYETTHSHFARLVHIDAYRIEDVKELKTLGFEEILKDPKNLIVVEWAERVAALIPAHALQVTLEDDGENMRKVTITHGER